MDWLVFVYRVPAKPSRDRVRIWRRLKRLGVLYLQQSVIIVPRQPYLEAALRDLMDEIRQVGGRHHLLQATTIDEEDEADIVASFQELRNEDYTEILEQCDLFFEELEMETRLGNLTAAEVEENEEGLERIRRWFHRVRKRDWFGATLQAAVSERIAECEAGLDEFALKVYDLETKEDAHGPTNDTD